METLLAAATREDELVTKLLRAFARNDRRASAEFATEIARNRGRSPGEAKMRQTENSEIGRSTLLTQGAYQDKLLESHRR